MKRIIIFIAALLCCLGSYAQKTSVSTNLFSFANLVTMNAELSYGFAKHFTVNTAVMYNPFEFDKDGVKDALRNKQLSASVGARYWPWHIYSGWWLAAKGQYQIYNTGGIRSMQTTEGNRYGAGIAVGYTYMLGKHFNVELGAGAWSGFDNYAVYDCPVCGLTVETGKKFFILPSDLVIALSYVF